MVVAEATTNMAGATVLVNTGALAPDISRMATATLCLGTMVVHGAATSARRWQCKMASEIGDSLPHVLKGNSGGSGDVDSEGRIGRRSCY